MQEKIFRKFGSVGYGVIQHTFLKKNVCPHTPPNLPVSVLQRPWEARASPRSRNQPQPRARFYARCSTAKTFVRGKSIHFFVPKAHGPSSRWPSAGPLFLARYGKFAAANIAAPRCRRAPADPLPGGFADLKTAAGRFRLRGMPGNQARHTPAQLREKLPLGATGDVEADSLRERVCATGG